MLQYFSFKYKGLSEIFEDTLLTRGSAKMNDIDPWMSIE